MIFPEIAIRLRCGIKSNVTNLSPGPWCYVESKTENDVFNKQYCNVPFCDDRDCELYVKETNTYSHFISFNQTHPNMSFSVRLWDPDNEADGVVRVLLSVVSVSGSKDSITRWDTGIELTISNNC